MMVTVLVRKGKLQVAYKSATCNLSLWITAGTEHACLKASEFLDVRAPLSPFLSFICSKTVLLHCTATPHTTSEASQGLYAEVPTRENCQSMSQAVKADASTACITYFQHTRLMSVQQTGDSFTAHPFLFSYAFHLNFIMSGFFSCIEAIDILPISAVVGIFPAKLAAL